MFLQEQSPGNIGKGRQMRSSPFQKPTKFPGNASEKYRQSYLIHPSSQNSVRLPNNTYENNAKSGFSLLLSYNKVANKRKIKLIWLPLPCKWNFSSWTNRRTNERTDEQTDEKTKVLCVLQDFVPFGAAAQKVRQINGHDSWPSFWCW